MLRVFQRHLPVPSSGEDAEKLELFQGFSQDLVERSGLVIKISEASQRHQIPTAQTKARYMCVAVSEEIPSRGQDI